MIYLDSAATSLHKPPQVAQAAADAIVQLGNAGRGAHEATLSAGRVVYEVREKLSELFGVGDPMRVCMMFNATDALNTAIAGLIRPGDHVVTTEAEHNSVLRPLYRAQRQGAQLTIVPMDKRTGRVREADILAAIRPDTRAVVCAHASNVTGNLLDIETIGAYCRAHGVLFVVDAAQSAGTFAIDMQRMGISALCVPGHKGLFGPQGTGALCVAHGVHIAPLRVGGSGVHSFSHEHPTDYPTALEAGTLNTPGIAGLSAGLDFILKTGITAIHAREIALARILYDGVHELDGVRVYGDWTTDRRAAIVTWSLTGWDSGEVSDILMQEYGICTRAGAHCAPLVHRAFGTGKGGLVRFSLSYFNTEEEVHAALDAVTELAQEDTTCGRKSHD